MHQTLDFDVAQRRDVRRKDGRELDFDVAVLKSMSILMVNLTKAPSLSIIPRTSVCQHLMGVVASPTTSSAA
ncbi:uncharacterized protein ARMOST_15288 [Armillaria ostoyae]|uniref:Uncharacterized protein n=1 Tax=Armillaria ostoyae TaxID=47428 RepID=A0A284RSZ2_ARMOS|nr:uncharacterized protein ARMOST_15288 [Armillaria ostoyae]